MFLYHCISEGTLSLENVLISFSFHLACYMSDTAAFVNSVYSRSQAQTSNVNIISPAFKRLLLAESEFAFLISLSK